MIEIKLELNGKNHGAFNLYEEKTKLGEMTIEIFDGELNAYHTEVNQSARGKGFAGKLLNEMVEYATNHNLKVKPSCSFVRASFEKNPEKYSTVWVKE